MGGKTIVYGLIAWGLYKAFKPDPVNNTLQAPPAAQQRSGQDLGGAAIAATVDVLKKAIEEAGKVLAASKNGTSSEET